MNIQRFVDHSWNVTPQEAVALQLQLRERVLICPLDIRRVLLITALRAICQAQRVIAVAVTLRMENWLVEDETFASLPLTFPYTSGLMAFTVAPVMLQAIAQLNQLGDVIMIEGHGLAHPRRLGIASHIGLLLDTPSLGCARSLLVGQAMPMPEEAGSSAPLIDGDETVGFAYRSRSGIKPIYVSIGHRMDAESILTITKRCVLGFRLPEPLRAARAITNDYLRKGV